MMKKIFILLFFLGIVGSASASDNLKQSEQKENTTKNEVYQSYLLKTQSLINKKFPDFFSELTQSEQLKWVDYVGRQGASFGYDNVNLRQGFTIISCYLGKDFMTDDNSDKDIKRFLQDERFSKYVRVRDMQRYLKRKKYQLNPPSVEGIE